nr:sugar phosphate nucleotidyltransferase [Paenibacillus aestuarii]
MKLILLSGGSGKRLWPLSNGSRSKQFLKLLKDPDGRMESMVQRVWRQLQSVGLTKHAFIATCEEQVDLIMNQLGDDVPIIVEPSRRDTFPAIALATTYLHSVEKIDIEEVVCVLPVDPYVEESFFYAIEKLEEIITSSPIDLALLGVNPTHPSEKYGYILPSLTPNPSGFHFQLVDHFIEKPDEKLAEQLIASHALWNCGVFAFKAKFLLNILTDKKLPVNYEELQNSYQELPQISFDYEVVEKTREIAVKIYNHDWKDLGTWNTFTEEMATNQIGDGIISEDSRNSYLINELNVPIVIQGLSDIVVAASPDGVLVTEKCNSEKIKSLISGMNNRPMFEERRWGTYRILDFSSCGEKQVLTKRLTIYAGKHTSYKTQKQRSKIWTIVIGEGLFAFDGHIYKIECGRVLTIPVGTMHGIKAISDLQIIEIQTGTNLHEEENAEIFMSWKEIEERCKYSDNWNEIVKSGEHVKECADN